MEVPACARTDKCMAGAINTDCPVCATNMTECVGVGAAEPVEDTEPVDDPEPEQPEDTDGNMGTDPARFGDCRRGRRCWLVFQGLPPQAAAGHRSG